MTLAGSLRTDTPAGHTLDVGVGQDGVLLVVASHAHAIWEALRLANLLAGSRKPSLRRLRNPLGQDIRVFIGDDLLAHWPAGSTPRPGRAATILKWLSHRRR